LMIYKNGTFWGYSQIGYFTTATVTYTKIQDIGTTAQLSWNSFAPWASNYTFAYRTSANIADPLNPIPAGPWLGTPAGALNQMKLTNLLPNKDYDCRVYVYANGGLWGVCQIGTFHTGVVGFNTSQDIGTTLLLDWTAQSWASNFTLQYRPLGGSTWSGIGTTTGPIKLSNLLPDSTYQCRVNVYKSGGLWGVSAISTFHTGEVVLSKVADNTTSMDFNWLPSLTSWASYYQMQFCIGSQNPPVSWVSMTSSSNTTLMITPILAGEDYWVRLRVFLSTGYWGTTKEQKIGRTTKSISRNENNVTESGLNIYPNPFAEQISLEISATETSTCTWTIYDMTGKLVLSGYESIMTGNHTMNIDAASLSQGNYMLNAVVNNETYRFRIMKQ
jgi:hypothetical protein